ncbi:MAG: hypothetical protein HY716_14805 [Planctomycetes bacterium]|nr:hypothetical protein [Planctomycetota bacterium]
MKTTLGITLGFWVAASQFAQAQNVDVTNGYGPHLTVVDLRPSTTSFDYLASVRADGAFVFKLTVEHNKVVKFVDTVTVADPAGAYDYVKDIDMSAWGLKPGDVIRFRATARLVANPLVVDEDVLIGLVQGWCPNVEDKRSEFDPDEGIEPRRREKQSP